MLQMNDLINGPNGNFLYQKRLTTEMKGRSIVAKRRIKCDKENDFLTLETNQG
jgi:hypothetical protein